MNPMRNFLPVASLSTILGVAGFCCGLYLLVVGRIAIVDFGGIAAICVPLLAIPQHTSAPTVATSSGEAVQVSVAGSKP